MAFELNTALSVDNLYPMLFLLHPILVSSWVVFENHLVILMFTLVLTLLGRNLSKDLYLDSIVSLCIYGNLYSFISWSLEHTLPGTQCGGLGSLGD